MNLKALQKEIPIKWKIQSFNQDKTKASCVAYIDARDVMNILDEVVGPENWQDDYKKVGDELMAGIGIKIDGEWVWKWDVGNRQEDKGYNTDLIGKAEVSDAFKRAAVKWGIGRFLYQQNIVWVRIDKNKNPVDKNGNRILDLNDYCNRVNEYFKTLKNKNQTQNKM